MPKAADTTGDDAIITEAPRDELRDSIDPHTGTLTTEAVAIRQAETAVPDWAGGEGASAQVSALSGDEPEAKTETPVTE